MPSPMRSFEEILKPRRLSSRAVYKALKKNEVHVYLAGPISFVEDLQEYRKQLTESLTKLSPKFKIHDPWEREQVSYRAEPVSQEERKALAEEVITRDLADIAQCDLVLAYMFRIGVGSSMEIFWASRILGKPVIVIYQPPDESSPQIPLWLLGHANLVFQTKKGLFNFLKRALEEIDNGQEE